MGLAEIAAGVEVTAEQRDRGVATVDDAGGDLVDRLRPYADALPCDPDAAAAVVDAYAAGQSIGAAGRVAGVPSVTAAKTLHLLGVDGVCPLSPTQRDILRDWLDARIAHSEARELIGVSESEFQLAAYIETHDPIPGARDAIEPVLGPAGDAMTAKQQLLAETMSSPDEFHN